MLTENELKALADEGYNRIAVVEQCLADLDTPLSIYLKLANRAESFLLESVEGGMRFARYSFIGLPARTKITVKLTETGPVTEVITDGKVTERVTDTDRFH